MDGLLDLLVVNRWEKARLWRNTSRAAGRWLGIQLKQPGPNPDAVGAWIEVRCGNRTMRREVAIGGGHASGQLRWWHFGLGTSPDAEVRVAWPNGGAGDWQRVHSNSFYVFRPNEPPRLYRPRHSKRP
jgi:enediyne biosynthesis protein E4